MHMTIRSVRCTGREVAGTLTPGRGRAETEQRNNDDECDQATQDDAPMR